jgi:hypothetical protein
MEPKIEKKFVCKLCKVIVEREKRIEHLLSHNPLEFFDYVDIISDTWEEKK